MNCDSLKETMVLSGGKSNRVMRNVAFYIRRKELSNIFQDNGINKYENYCPSMLVAFKGKKFFWGFAV